MLFAKLSSASVPPLQLSQRIVRLYREGKSENPRCFIQNVIQIFTRLQPCETDDQYLLDYFNIVLPNM